MSVWYSRGDMAAEYYDKLLFGGATFADLRSRNTPLLYIQATDMVSGNCFGFTPYQFGIICSDLDAFPISRAVAASSAFPAAFDAIILKNYAGECGNRVDPLVTQALEENPRTSRIFRAASISQVYLDVDKKPYIHLFDGGVCDNLGIRGPLNHVIIRGGVRDYLDTQGLEGTRRVIFIIVNAEGKASSEWSIGGKLASIPRVLGSSSSMLLKSYTFETIELLKSYVHHWSNEAAASDGAASPLDFYVVEVSFDALLDADERRFFMQVPTALTLPESTVDRLIVAGRKILYESKEFQRLLEDLGATLPLRKASP